MPTPRPHADALLWLDLETTGSDEQLDDIVEVGAILTTPDLVELSDFQAIVRPSRRAWGRLLGNPDVRAMHEASGLLAELEGLSDGEAAVAEVERWLLTFLDEHVEPEEKVVLAGSGVGHFDQRFLARHMPTLHDRLAYFVVDVGVLRRTWEMWTGTVVSTANDAKTHRALDDVRCHLAEARAFAARWRHLLDGEGMLRDALAYVPEATATRDEIEEHLGLSR